ncbi:carbohydrate ABC transporter permease [Ruminococcus flavefaciens]|uniref:Carbohydrate ABC transporter membrane protein 2, CUT1 family n=1 Tax=Ruminococcus flavefaciens TaxID=1265 RepID=A0A1M7HWP0_RUMFL|nr:carbohydrate ABC transporter permease [Ruminococcus flavefaciens]SHM32904.1 carbohydrate ABC transporter membrane protein 2, CUT1 family [Ruminococcus flavefaciens]
MSNNMKDVYGKAKDNYSFKIKLKSGILCAWFIILTIICLLPIYILIINATRTHTDIANGLSFVPGSNIGNNFKKIFTDPTFKLSYNALHGYKNSLLITVCSTFLTVFFSALTAYGIHVYDFKIKELSYSVILLVMMVPMQVTSAGFVAFMSDLHLTNTYWPLIIPAVAAPAVVYFMRSYMKSSFPLDIVEAARIDGCSEFRTFLSIAIPMMKPAIAVQSIFAFIASWNNFYTPNMILINVKLNKKTLPMMVAALQSSDKFNDYGAIYLAIALSIIPIIIAYVLLSRFIIAGVALGGVKE